MRFALVESKKVEASPGAVGMCPGCGQPMVAKCGLQRVHHWAHRRMACDPWWEPETEWHRTWKNNFPTDWQEVFLPDERTGEKHIADVRTPHGLVVEFQHSHIDPHERTTRERFYQDMVWVVDGKRLKSDYLRFIKGGKNYIQSLHNGMHNVYNPNRCFPKGWLNSTVPVIFDFGGLETVDDKKGRRNSLCCLFPGRFGNHARLAAFPREVFVNSVISGQWSEGVRRVLDKLPQAEPPMEEIPYQAKEPPVTQKVFVRIKRRPSPYVYDHRKGKLVRRKRF